MKVTDQKKQEAKKEIVKILSEHNYNVSKEQKEAIADLLIHSYLTNKEGK
tara:strand:- start:3568 stop:3717 length:150 start_codon:yes stop_codon:yes gene_type:complete